MEPIDYLRAIGRRWRVVLACLVLAGAGAYLTAPAQASGPATSSFLTYSATATLLQSNSAGRSLQFTQLYMQRGQIPVEVAAAIGGKQSGPQVAAQVSITIDNTVGTLTISSSGSDPVETARLVNTYAETSIAYFNTQAEQAQKDQLAQLATQLKDTVKTLSALDAQAAAKPGDSIVAAQRAAIAAQYQALFQQQQRLITGPTPTGGLSLLEKATPLAQSTSGFAPPSGKTGRLALGAGLGLVLGLVLALVLDRVDTRVRGRAPAQRLLGAPVLAELPRLRRRFRRIDALPVVADPVGETAEAFRTLRSALSLLPARSLPAALLPWGAHDADPPSVHEPPTQVLLVISARAGEGKSTVVANLAAAVASTGRSVLIIDADLRHPSLHQLLDFPADRGLADLTASDAIDAPNSAAIRELFRPSRLPGVSVLPAGTPERATMMAPGRLPAVLTAARKAASVVIIDSPPVLSSSDAVDLMPHVDSVLVVVRNARTTASRLRRVSELLARVRVPVLGSVLVGGRRPLPSTWPLRRSESSAHLRALIRRDDGERTTTHGVSTTPAAEGSSGEDRPQP